CLIGILVIYLLNMADIIDNPITFITIYRASLFLMIYLIEIFSILSKAPFIKIRDINNLYSL
ncbi:hypothetical protein, partial [Francisella tularensis]|uniref:hypothetical protein n=1 Tax=Francisella tularensis TaxID=263 RepID=UPI002381A7C7